MAAPCARCGWEWEGFHICFDASKKVEGEYTKQQNRSGYVDGKRNKSWNKSLSDAANAHWARVREQNKERDERIVARYREGLSYKALMKEFKLSNSTVINIMHAARNRGEVIIRPKGKSR